MLQIVVSFDSMQQIHTKMNTVLLYWKVSSIKNSLLVLIIIFLILTLINTKNVYQKLSQNFQIQALPSCAGGVIWSWSLPVGYWLGSGNAVDVPPTSWWYNIQ